MKLTYTLVIVLVLSCSRLVMAESSDPNLPLLQIATSIAEVKSVGYWEKGEKHGHYRIVVVNEGWEHISSQVYIQAIEVAADPDQDNLVLSTLPVKEVNDPNIWSVGILRTSYIKQKIVVTLNGTNTYSPTEKKQFRITLLEPEKYQLTK